MARESRGVLTDLGGWRGLWGADGAKGGIPRKCSFFVKDSHTHINFIIIYYISYIYNINLIITGSGAGKLVESKEWSEERTHFLESSRSPPCWAGICTCSKGGVPKKQI